jgi:hypothetical protein
MNESQKKSSNTDMSNQLWLSVATVPILITLMGTKAVAEWLQGAGMLAEEVFRGERLPLLHFPPSDSKD